MADIKTSTTPAELIPLDQLRLAHAQSQIEATKHRIPRLEAAMAAIEAADIPGLVAKLNAVADTYFDDNSKQIFKVWASVPTEMAATLPKMLEADQALVKPKTDRADPPK